MSQADKLSRFARLAAPPAAFLALASLLVLVPGGCVKLEVPRSAATIADYRTPEAVWEQEMPGCRSMLDGYCDYLHSPAVMGNVRVPVGESTTIDILKGHTYNDFTVVYYEYLLAVQRNNRSLPKDFRIALGDLDYFAKLERYLSRKPIEKMGLSERLADVQLASDLATDWRVAVEQTVLSRMSKQDPDFHRLPDRLVPIELKTMAQRVRRELWAEVALAVWQQHPKWKNVEQSFERVRRHFIEVVARLDMPEPMRREWTERLRSVELVLPSSRPEIADLECAQTRSNAYYYYQLNLLTVCAGDFSSEDISQTIAHELAHALDVDRSMYLFQKKSAIGRDIADLRVGLCRPGPFACESWERIKEKFPDRVKRLRNFKADLPALQSCLKSRQTSLAPSEETFEEIATQISNERVGELADREVYLRVTKEKVPMVNGKQRKNPNYLNPCSYDLWAQGEEPIDGELTNLFFFTAEYRCTTGPDERKMMHAIEVAKEMERQVISEVLRMESDLSSRYQLVSRGFSSSPAERFADALSSHVLAEILLKELPDVASRRGLFLASNTWQCLRPSLAKLYPRESAVQRGYVFESHASSGVRQRESLPEVMRLALSCRKDFEFTECVVPFAAKPVTPPSSEETDSEEESEDDEEEAEN